jgi:uncharacterized membrane protein YeiB
MTAHPVGPMQTPERHEAIDLLRGFGVLGILMIERP